MARCLMLVAAIGVTGCTHTQLAKNTVRQADSVADIHTQQVLDNVAKFVDNPHALPHFSWPNEGASNVDDSVNGNAGFNFSPSHLTDWMFGVGGSRNMGESYTMTPINDPRKLELMRCAYQRAVAACCRCQCESAHCPACQARFNAFYLGSEEPGKTKKVTDQGSPIYDVKSDVKLRCSWTDEAGNRAEATLAETGDGEAQYQVYETRDEKNRVVFKLLSASNGVPAGAQVHKEKEGVKGTLGRGDLEALYVDDSVAMHTIRTGTVTSACLHSCCWFNVGEKCDAPHRCECAYVGKHCDTYVWVPECGRDQLTKLTLTILDIALNDPPEGRSKEVVAYYDSNGKAATRTTATYQVTATIPLDTSEKVLDPTDEKFAPPPVELARTVFRNAIDNLMAVPDGEAAARGFATAANAPMLLAKIQANDPVAMSSLARLLVGANVNGIDNEAARPLVQSAVDASGQLLAAERFADSESQRAATEAERDSVKMLPPQRTRVNTGFLQFEQSRRAATGR